MKFLDDGALDNSTTRVLVMSDSGKPIFSSRFESEEDVVRICGLLQAIRSSSLYCSTLQLGDILSARASSLHMVYMNVDAITLVAVSTIKNEPSECESLEIEATLRLQLEYIYAQIIFSVTEQVQMMYMQNSSFDLRSMLGSDTSIKAILESSLENESCLLTAGIQTVFPLSFASRENASSVLKRVGDETANTVFAILFVGKSLVSVVQPASQLYQLKTSDLYLLLEFIHCQKTASGELWIPVCLPRFNSSGFLNCYTQTLDDECGLQLALLSQDGTTDQFQYFRTAAVRIRRCLGIPDERPNVLEIVGGERINEDTVTPGKDVAWRRNDKADDFVEEDYEIISHEASTDSESPQLRDELRTLRDSTAANTLFEDILSVGVLHFCFRVDASINNEAYYPKTDTNLSSTGTLSQCLCSPLPPHYADTKSKRRIWRNYRRLALRRRLGSSQSDESCVAKDVGTYLRPTISKNCTSIGLSERLPDIQGVSYMKRNGESFLAMNGRGFELYLFDKSDLPVEETAALGAELVRKLTAAEQTLFLTNPLTWKKN